MENNQWPALSILIPCYNHARYLPTCLNSVSDAYPGEIHIILVDDASKDESFTVADELLQQLALKYPHHISYDLIRNEQNLGITTTLNRALTRVSTDYLYIMASDDYLTPGGLESAISTMLTSQADVVVSDCHVVDEQNNMVFNSALFDRKSGNHQAYTGKGLRDELVIFWIMPGPVTLVRTKFYQQIGPYSESLKAEDRDFYLRALAHGKVIFNDHRIANYRVHTTNTSQDAAFIRLMNHEMITVSLQHAPWYSGLSKLFLMSYHVDRITHSPCLGRCTRYVIKLIYWLKCKFLN